ncbi:MAG TPA: PucC family protein, partial [Steroidobacteraceae bacterium]|nr:PucC family protein [Steroidobacteraceae bacterium]
QFRLIQVVQGSALMTFALNTVALWKQEARDPGRTAGPPPPPFLQSWLNYSTQRHAVRFLVAVSLGTAAFNMQDIILEPYGGAVLHLSVAATTSLTAMLAAGALLAFGLAARALTRGFDPCRLAAYGILVGLVAFAIVIASAPLGSPLMFRCGGAAIGFGNGLFCVGTLAAAMEREQRGASGLALGAWGAVQAGAAGIAMAAGGALRDAVAALADGGALGPALTGPAVGYGFVYQLEILLLFVALAVMGPLVGVTRGDGLGDAAALGVAVHSGQQLAWVQTE